MRGRGLAELRGEPCGQGAEAAAGIGGRGELEGRGHREPRRSGGGQGGRGPPGRRPAPSGVSAAGRLEEDVVGAVGDLAALGHRVLGAVRRGRGEPAHGVDALDVGGAAEPVAVGTGRRRVGGEPQPVDGGRVDGLEAVALADDPAAVAGLPRRPAVVAADRACRFVGQRGAGGGQPPGVAARNRRARRRSARPRRGRRGTACGRRARRSRPGPAARRVRPGRPGRWRGPRRRRRAERGRSGAWLSRPCGRW